MAAEPELYQPDALAEEEPRYLRRQKPVEIRRRKFGKAAWRLYFKYALIAAAVAGAGCGVYAGAQFLLYSPRFILADSGHIEVSGQHFVSREAVLAKFAGDTGRSILRLPLGERRKALEEIPWVAQASVRRVLPNRILVQIEERIPAAFLRQAGELALVDEEGVILERPVAAQFNFPVVQGLDEGMPPGERRRRMQVYAQFMKEVEIARGGASASISEVDLADGSDLRATLAGMPELGDPAAGGQATVLVHFGSGGFLQKFRVLVENIGQWRNEAGRVESVDLRFDRQVVVNPEAVARR